MKKIISAILCLIMLAAPVTVSAYMGPTEHLPLKDDETYTAGDVNDDGALNALDVHALKSSVAGYDVYINADAADLDADAKANARDVLYFKAVLAGVSSIEDYTSGAPVYKLTVAGTPISSFDIAVPDGTSVDTDNAYLAAVLLQTYVKAASGFKPEIVYESEKTHSRRIVFHAVAPMSEESEEMGLGLEDYIYEVKDGDLHIYGTLRGNMYAAYEICEKYLGFRFYDDRYTYSYRMRVSDIPEGTYVYHKVPLSFRFTGNPIGDTETFYQCYLARRMNGTQIYVGGSSADGYFTGPRFANAHSFYLYKAMMAGSYPDDPGDMDLRAQIQYKYMDGQKKIDMRYYECEWQPCTSTDLSYYEMYNGMLETTEMVQDWGTNKYTEYLGELGIYAASFSQDDNAGFCTCTTCVAKANGNTMSLRKSTLAQLEHYSGDYTISADGKKVTFKKESYAGLMMDFAVRAAKEITTEYHGYEFDFEDNFPPLREDIRKVYPGMKIYLMTYDFSVPESVRPVENIILIYCGHGCNNHILGTGGCGENTTTLGGSNKMCEESMPAWAQWCHECGASVWYWSYGITYSYYLAPCPNVPDFYYNMKYLYDLGFDGVYYESCGGPHNNFEDMKAYLAAQVMWQPDMTYEEFTDIVKEYMYMYYGDGYEYVYDYMLLQTEAGDAAGCYVNNYSRPFDMYDAGYLSGHWEEMRNDLLRAIDMAGDDYHRINCERLFPACEFMGLSSAYNAMYVNGTAEQRAEYEKRYTDMYNYLQDEDNGVWIYPDPDFYDLPETAEITDNPMNMFYGFGSWREYVK